MHCFFIVPPPPPTSTLFPYTTLFRSIAIVAGLIWLAGARLAAELRDIARAGPSIIEAAVDQLTGGQNIDVVGQTITSDRKSTRLNSSHITISYAGFCLKKKK